MKKIMIVSALAMCCLMTACTHKKDAPDVTPKTAMSATGTPVVQASFNHEAPDVVKLNIAGAHCEDCYNTIKSEIGSVQGVKASDADVSNKTMFVQVSNNTPEVQAKIKAAVVKAGYNVEGTPESGHEACKTDGKGGMMCKDGEKCEMNGEKCEMKDGKCMDGEKCDMKGGKCCKDGDKCETKAKDNTGAKPEMK